MKKIYIDGALLLKTFAFPVKLLWLSEEAHCCRVKPRMMTEEDSTGAGIFGM